MIDTCLSIGFLILVALAIFTMAQPRESREVEQFIQMLMDALKKIKKGI
jgi:hypothetical protein